MDLKEKLKPGTKIQLIKELKHTDRVGMEGVIERCGSKWVKFYLHPKRFYANRNRQVLISQFTDYFEVIDVQQSTV